MEKKFNTYLKSIGMGNRLIKRVEEIYAFYEETAILLDDQIKDIFIHEYIEADLKRHYESAWFFSDKYMFEAKSFIKKEDDFDMAILKDGITYIVIKKESYDFRKANDKSRLTIEFDSIPNNESVIRASKRNCDNLRDIMLKYLVPNFKEYSLKRLDSTYLSKVYEKQE